MPDPQSLTRNQAVSSRWEKTYRKLHNLYIFEELVHIDDFKRETDHIHQRIDQLNQKLDQNLNNIASQFASHVHQVTTAGGPTSQAGVAAAPGPLSVDPSPIVRTPFKDIAMQAANNEWFLKGPTTAPLAQGTSAAALEANAASLSQTAGEG